MFDQNISGELPEHIDFIKNKCIPLFAKWGYKTKILHAEKTYLDIFMGEPTKGRRKGSGLLRGFPMMGKCAVNKSCKVKPIKDFYKILDCDYVQYIAIATDEPERLARMKTDALNISLLEKYGYTEKMAIDLCKKYDLLSPIYNFADRGGCWFCPNARDSQLRYLRKNHSDLWNILLDLELKENLIGNIWRTLTKTSIYDKEMQFYFEEGGK